MEIRIRYRNNRVDVFDADTFTKSEPFGNANMLTDFEVLFDQLGKTGIWLAAHSYDASSCNGCDIEVLASLTPLYDAERFGVINPEQAQMPTATTTLGSTIWS